MDPVHRQKAPLFFSTLVFLGAVMHPAGHLVSLRQMQRVLVLHMLAVWQ